MPQDTRPARVAAQMRQELSRLLSRDLTDPRMEGLIITSVAMSKDLRVAKVLYRLAVVATGKELEARTVDAQGALERASGRIKRAVTERLGLRCAPELRFAYDSGQDARSRIDQLLHEVDEDLKRR
jgi:ribosome-binding factor A